MTFGGSNNRGPSIAELQRFIREKTTLVFMLANGNQVVGQLKWADENAFQILPAGQQPFTILRSAVLGYHRHGEGAPKVTATPKQVAQPAAQPAAVAAGETTSTTLPSLPAPAAEKPAEPKPDAAADDK